ncbi:PREDICTED: CD209 antigen-like protein 2 [Miniopterus natalensis]|uniref:CD209 antigen-like protein 2 n=1 Tax=Miniopterus natalensis TaxID=291302 RepID=UPI0007A71296|nr:PREDICTED: CD209 antigen-like protein 2 [Miniopterus natalensis]
MAEMCVPKEPGGHDEAKPPFWGDGGEGRAPGSCESPEEREIFQGQRSAEKDPRLSRSLRSLPGCLTRAPLSLMLLLVSLGIFMLMLITLVKVSRIQQSLPREMDNQGSHSPVVVLQELMQSDLEEILQQLTTMNATLAGLCRPCPWNWDFFQGSCYMFSQIQATWKASVSACEDMRAQLVVINNAEEQKFLKSWNARINKRTWIGLSDQHNEGSWHWVDNTPIHLSFWKEGEPNNHEDEDCVELDGEGWNDSKCSAEYFWICEKPSAVCPGL